MARFYLPQSMIVGQSLELPQEVSRHIQVFRMQPGQQITLFNGQGGEYLAHISQIQRKIVSVNIEQFINVDRELTSNIEIWPAVMSNERMDWLVEKSVELGASAIQPLQSQHSAFRLTEQKAEKKRQHWQSLAIAAAQQSGRNKITQIKPIITLNDAADLIKNQLLNNQKFSAIVLSLQQGSKMVTEQIEQLDNTTNWLIISGPEGGLTLTEEQLIFEAGGLAGSLGQRVLRAETAPIMALSLLNGLKK